jgi:hypothetical protein
VFIDSEEDYLLRERLSKMYVELSELEATSERSYRQNGVRLNRFLLLNLYVYIINV